jgi:hypothetical protein
MLFVSVKRLHTIKSKTKTLFNCLERQEEKKKWVYFVADQFVGE